MGPFQIETTEQYKLWFSYKQDVKNHKSWNIRNQYFKNRNMDGWEEELKKIERDMREKMRVLKIQQNKEEKERLQMQEEEESINNNQKTIKNNTKYEKMKDTREKNKEMIPRRISKRIREKQSKLNNDIEIVSIKTVDQVIEEKMKDAIKKGNFIDLTI